MTTDKTNKPKSFRLKVIKPVYETLTIKEELPDYLRRNRRITSSSDVYHLFQHMMEIPRENFVCLLLDAKNKIICVDYVSQGSVSAALVHPMQVFISAVLVGASACVYVHQHPSGDPEPSREDIALTQRLKECSELLGFKTLDSIVIGDGRYVSFADRGLI